MLGVRTTKPIATISFNTPDYLAKRLEDLRKAGKISFWAFIPHLPEDDEGGKKDHSHVFVEPAKMLQTDDVTEALKEFDPVKPDKPRGCIAWRSSKFADWYLYALHDAKYLAMKGQSRKYHYKHEQIRASDEDDLLYRARSIDMLALSPYAAMEEAVKSGLTWSEYFRRGTVPIPLIRQFQEAWTMLSSVQTYRAGRAGHDVDEETGEVTEDDN